MLKTKLVFYGEVNDKKFFLDALIFKSYILYPLPIDWRPFSRTAAALLCQIYQIYY